MLLRFMHMLSQLYQGLEVSYPSATFEKHEFSVPGPPTIEKYLPVMAHLVETYYHSELGTKYAELNRSISRVDWRIPRSQIEKLRAKIQDPLLKLSIQDCLTAYVVTVINRCATTPIDKVRNAASVRDFCCRYIQDLLFLLVPSSPSSFYSFQCCRKCYLHSTYRGLQKSSLTEN